MSRKLPEKTIETILKNTRTTLETEGLFPSKENDVICEKYLRGEISEEDAREEILKSLKKD